MSHASNMPSEETAQF